MTHDSASEITREYIQTGIREEVETLTHTLLNKVPKGAAQFQPRKGMISGITSADLISMEMDETLQVIVDGSEDINSSIEHLTYLFLARMVAARVESGAILGSRNEEMSKPVKKKAESKKKVTKTPDPEPAAPSTGPETTAEVLESNQDFLAQTEDSSPADVTPEAAIVEPIELTKADNGVLDLL